MDIRVEWKLWEESKVRIMGKMEREWVEVPIDLNSINLAVIGRNLKRVFIRNISFM